MVQAEEGVSLTILRADLASALAVAARMTSDRDQQELRLKATRDQLIVSATDMSHWLHLSVPCGGEIPSVCVHASRLNEVIATALSEVVSLHLDGGMLKIAAGKGRRSLTTVPADNWPEREFEAKISITVDAAPLGEALRFTLPSCAAANDLAHSQMSGVHLFTDGVKLKAAGTDTFNLAVIEVADCTEQISVTVSPKMAEIMGGLVSGPVELGFTERACEARWGSGRIIGPLIHGDFPVSLIRQLLARECPSSFIVDANEFRQALRSVRPVGHFDNMSRSTAVRLSLNGSASLSTSAQEGSAEQEFTADWDGGEFETGFASARMMRLLDCFGDDVLTVGVGSSADAMRFTAAAKSDRVAIIYPMRI